MPDLANAFTGTDRYVVQRRIGVGGMGVVYDAFDRERGHRVALKTLAYADPAAIYRLKREFRALADVAHPNLVTLYELVSTGDEWFIAMELIDGVHFTQWTRPNESFDERRLRDAMRQLGEGLGALHASGYAHRDVKPSNVLVARDGRVVVLDFGISLELSTHGRMETTETATYGTVDFMAPEQAAGERGGPASDWYAVGTMLFEGLTGRLPFQGSTVSVFMRRQVEDAPSPAALVAGLPPDLVALCSSLLARDPARRPSSDTILRRLGASTSGPSRRVTHATRSAAESETLVGREPHLAALEAAFAAARAGAPVTVCVSGVSGMGKSTVVRHFLEQVGPRPHTVVLTGRCFDRETVPYKGIDGVVDALSRYLHKLDAAEVAELLPDDVAASTRLFPVLLRVEAVANAPRLTTEAPDPIERRRRGVAALRALLTRIAARHTVVIAIDDLQWADADSVALLDDLLRPPDAPALLVVTSFRSEDVQRSAVLRTYLDQTHDAVDRRRLDVGPLRATEAFAVVTATLGALPNDSAIVDAIVREANGNAFLLEQLARHVRDAGRDADAPATGVTLGEMIDARLAALPEGARAVVETLAVAGGPTPAEVVQRAAGLSGDVRALLGPLRVASLVRADATGEQIELYHDRIRESVAARLDPARVKWLHLSLAESLTTRSDDDPEVLCAHYAGSGDTARAAVHALRAAARSAASLAFERAARYYAWAIELGAEPPQNDPGGLHALHADALVNAGRPNDAARAYIRAAELAPPASESLALERRRRAAEQYLIGGHHAEGLAVIRELASALGIAMPRASGRRALAAVAWQQLRLQWRGLRWTECLERDVPEDRLARLDMIWTFAVGLALVEPVVAANFMMRYLRMALDAGEPNRLARAFCLSSGFRAQRGAGARAVADRYVAETRALAMRLGTPRAEGLAALAAGSVAFLNGEWRRAATRCAEAEAIFRAGCTNVTWEITTALTFGLSSTFYAGDLAELARRVPTLLATALEREDLLLATDLRTRLHVAWLVLGRPDEVHRHVRDALSHWPATSFLRQHYNGLLAQCQADLYAGDAAAAHARVEEAWPRLAGSMLMARIQLLRLEALFLRARCALALADAPNGRTPRETLHALADRCARQIARERVPWATPLALLLRGAVSAQRGERDHALVLLGGAAEGFDRADMAVHATITRRRAAQLGGAGAELAMQSADAWLRARLVADPARFAGLVAPGFAA